MTTPYAEITVQTDKISMESQTSDRSGAISALEACAHVLRVDEERDGLQERVDIAKVKGKKLARVLNERMYFCECGNVFATQNGYAGHRNHCHE